MPVHLGGVLSCQYGGGAELIPSQGGWCQWCRKTSWWHNVRDGKMSGGTMSLMVNVLVAQFLVMAKFLFSSLKWQNFVMAKFCSSKMCAGKMLQ